MHSHKILNFFPIDISSRDRLINELKISPILSQVLINRGISDPDLARKFLDAQIRHMLDPFLFSDMRKAVERVKRAIKDKEKILIFGDYDVDGITSVAILSHTLKKAGLTAQHYMPHRIKEGYGLSKDILKIAREKAISLLITADCGISNIKEVAQLKRHGIDTIITDHHQPHSDTLPEALAIINPKVKSSNYPYLDLAGVGVAYKFCQAISGSMLAEELDLVAIGTVADVVPLTGENRVIVKEGLRALAQTKRPGIRALIEKSGIRSSKLSPTFISFILSPRLNAAGRMDSAEISLNLLASEDMAQAQDLASLLELHNRARQKVECKILEEAEAIINKEVNFKEHKVIVVAKEDWHQGVLGIVASKLADRFYRPVIVISLDDGICKGSGRSIKNFHLFDALGECSEFLHGFGGHAHAAGITITRESVDDFRESINQLAQKKMSLEDLLPSVEIDMELSLSDLDDKSVSELDSLAPFGKGNAEPLFFTRGLKLKGEPRSLARETLKFYAADGNNTREVIGFGMGSLMQNLKEADAFDLIYTARMDNWQDEPGIILEAKEIFFK